MSQAAVLDPQSLPEWRLGDLYAAPDDPALAADLAGAEALAEDFAKRWQGRLAGLTGKDLGEAIAAHESLSEILGRVMSYAVLRFTADSGDAERGRFLQTTQERITDISTQTLFFTLELNRIADDVLERQLADPAAGRYRSWLRDLRVYRPHQLSDDLEKLLHEKQVAGWSAFTRLFDQTMAALRFRFEGKMLTSAEIFHRLSDKDGAVRQKAARSIGKVLAANQPVFTLIYNTLIKDKAIEDRWRGYARPTSARNLGNQVEDEVVEALTHSVRAAFPKIAHRYYALKARWLGQDKLNHWDRNAPLPEDDDRLIPWDEAKQQVLDAYGAFSPKLAEIAGRFFTDGWIDARLRPGKTPGAFSHPTVPSVHPYILMNYQGRARDVMTLAHELGHGVHQVLAAPRGLLMSDTPLTLAETASVFGEMLTFRALLDGEADPKRRRVLLAGKVEDMINTVVRQIAFYEFEKRVHAARAAGELSAEQFGKIWMKAQKDSLGPAFRFTKDYRTYWSYIPHFIHSPFYVYAYAFGDCLVNALYDVFRAGHPGFQGKYLDMLAAGGTLRHKELLAPFGLNAADPAFWDRGLSVLAGFVDELEGCF